MCNLSIGRLEAQEFEASVGYIMSLMSAWAV